MSIVLDIGNTRVKVAQFKNQQLLNVFFYNKDNIIEELKNLTLKLG